MEETIPFDTLGTFESLPLIRKIISRGDFGFSVSDCNIGLDDKTCNSLAAHDAVSIQLLRTEAGAKSPERSISENLHKLASLVFNNISHGIELPWERYLSEMHEYDVPNRSDIKIVQNVHEFGDAWSTLTILVSMKQPRTAVILFGEALSVFTDGSIPSSFKNALDAIGPVMETDGRVVVYSVCPNDDVLYTRVAGALMRPLSSDDLSTALRIMDFDKRRIHQ